MKDSFDFSQALNPLYGYDAVQDQMRTSFVRGRPSVLLLPDFLTTRAYTSLVTSLDDIKGTFGVFPERYSFTRLLLTQSHRAFFASPAFFDFVRSSTSIKVKDVRVDAFRLNHRDFTLLHDDQPSHERFIFFYTLASAPWKATSGGSIVFSFGDERDPLVFEPKPNSLVLFKVPSGMRDFVKYINHFAGSNHLTYIVGEFLLK